MKHCKDCGFKIGDRVKIHPLALITEVCNQYEYPIYNLKIDGDNSSARFFNGNVLELIERPIKCSHCNGTGFLKDPRINKCPIC